MAEGMKMDRQFGFAGMNRVGGIFHPWLRSCSVVDVHPRPHNALPWPKASRPSGYTFSQKALMNANEILTIQPLIRSWD
jgi:hypothetical protein